MTFCDQRRILSAVMDWVHWPLTFAGVIVIVTGILLGIVLGPIHQWTVIWQTRYGITWVIALLIGIFTLAWGVFAGNKMAIKLFSQKEIWRMLTMVIKGLSIDDWPKWLHVKV